MKIGVIGAGPSGVTTVKQLLDEGHDVTCFEKNASLGGIWYRHEGDGDEMKVFDGMLLTISLKLMAYSDFMPRDRSFVDHKGYLRYLESYVDKFGLRPHIQVESKVTDIAREGDGWRVTVNEKGGDKVHRFEALALCTGPFRTPNKDSPDLDKFDGEVVHSSRYRNNRNFQGKRVLVVGLAESGGDIVREVSDVASECTLSLRSYSFLLPRLYHGRYSVDEFEFRGQHWDMYGRATDTPYALKGMFEDDEVSRSEFLAAVKRHAMEPPASPKVVRQETETNNLGQPLYPLKLDLFTENSDENVEFINEWNRKSHNYEGNYSQRIIFCKNVSFVPNMRNGKIRINDTGIESIRGNSIRFKDGTTKEVDTIVLCTGFVNDFSLLSNVTIEDNNVRSLYKHSIHPEYGGRLALIGFVRPFSGGIPICAEMQARYFALLCSSKVNLPANLPDVIRKEREWEETWTALSPRHPESIPSQILYLDSIAREIGCLPRCSALLEDPKLLLKLWFSSFNQSCYRLTGPHSMPETALDQVMGEDLPAGQEMLMSYFATMLSMSSSFHPKDLLLARFPKKDPYATIDPSFDS